MSEDKKVFIAGMEQMLKGHGFEDVCVEATDIPKNLLQSMKEELEAEGEEDIEVEEFVAEFEYYKVATKQGNFGIFMGAYWHAPLSSDIFFHINQPLAARA